jgi:hypothetical protein
VNSPTPGFRHLVRLTDDTGLYEHARHAVVRRRHGYCTDDVARGLVVISREPQPSHRLTRIAECYLASGVSTIANPSAARSIISWLPMSWNALAVSDDA